MAFPSTLDTTSTIPVEASSTPLSTNHVANHTAMQTAIIAIETLLGVTASAVTGTFNYILGEITGSDKAVGKTATQSISNKTITASSINGVTPTTAGSATDFLAANGTYQTVSISNASTTVKGIVEAATSAEVTAGTASGGTGAALVVTPDALAASTPVFDGSGITNISGKISITTTDVTISNTTTETNILSQSISGGTLGTNNAVRVTLHVSSLVTGQASGTDPFTFRFKYGATTLITFTLTPTAATNYMGKLEFILAGAGTTSSQNGSLVSNLGEPTYVGNGNTRRMYFTDSSQGTSAIDSTSSQTLLVTGQYGSANASNIATVSLIVIEKIK